MLLILSFFIIMIDYQIMIYYQFYDFFIIFEINYQYVMINYRDY